jgi:hypothetical protein
MKSRHGGVPVRATACPSRVRLVTVLAVSHAVPFAEIIEGSKVPDASIPPRGGFVTSSVEVEGGGGVGGEVGLPLEQLQTIMRRTPSTSGNTRRRGRREILREDAK